MGEDCLQEMVSELYSESKERIQQETDDKVESDDLSLLLSLPQQSSLKHSF